MSPSRPEGPRRQALDPLDLGQLAGPVEAHDERAGADAGARCSRTRTRLLSAAAAQHVVDGAQLEPVLRPAGSGCPSTAMTVTDVDLDAVGVVRRPRAAGRRARRCRLGTPAVSATSATTAGRGGAPGEGTVGGR